MSEELQYTAFQSRYRDKQYIGAGGFGKVYKVFDHAKNHYVALKVSDVRPEWNKFTLKNEVELVNKLNHHRNIARYDACYRFNTGITGEMDFALLKFYEDGNLEQFLKKSELSQEDKRLIIGGILNGLSFLHDNNIIHRDLKAENILMSREDGVWTPKITDFGLSREVSSSANITNSAVGISYAYAAPEQILNQKIYRNVDIWAIGVIIYRIIADDLPFADKQQADKKSVNTQLEISKKITSNQLPAKLETLDEPFRSIIKRCLVSDPLERAQSPSELISLLKGDRALDKPPTSVKPIEADRSEEVISSADDEKTILTPRSQPAPDAKTDSEDVGSPEEYEMPSQNQTQFIPQSVTPVTPSGEADRPEEIVGQSSGGDRKSSSTLPFLIGLVLFCILGAAGAWWFWGSDSKDSATASTKGEVTFIPQSEASAPVSDNRYAELEEEIKTYSNGGAQSDRVMEELRALTQDPANATNYRPFFLLGLNQAITEQSPRVVFESLRESATIAVKNNAASQLLADMQEAEFESFERVSKLPNWSEMISQLKKYQ